MGHRANFVIIRNDEATAYHDQWAALGSTYGFMAGPEIVAEETRRYECVDGLMDWAFAEAGYLIDFDVKVAIVFGCPEIFADYDDQTGEPIQSDSIPNDVQQAILALDDDPKKFLSLIQAEWRGWKLVWDDRGVDAFALYLQNRGFTNIETAAISHPPDVRSPVELETQT